MESYRWQAAHLPFFNEMINLTVFCWGVDSYSHHVQHEIGSGMQLLLLTFFLLKQYQLIWLHCKQIKQLHLCCIYDIVCRCRVNLQSSPSVLSLHLYQCCVKYFLKVLFKDWSHFSIVDGVPQLLWFPHLLQIIHSSMVAFYLVESCSQVNIIEIFNNEVLIQTPGSVTLTLKFDGFPAYIISYFSLQLLLLQF